MHPLDNPIWQSLITTHAHFAETCKRARKFPHEVNVLAGFAEPSHENYDSLASLLRPEEQIGLFLQEPPDLPAGWTVIRNAPLLQMLHEKSTALPERQPEFVQLSHADVPEMLALTKLTNPGPFRPRTYEMGDYFGVRIDGTLAAMAGERLRLPGYTEISAVCTHPEHVGHGYASALIAKLVDGICKGGETPFLHVLPSNTRAIQVYERLGFTKRTTLHVVGLRHDNFPNPDK